MQESKEKIISFHWEKKTTQNNNKEILGPQSPFGKASCRVTLWFFTGVDPRETIPRKKEAGTDELRQAGT